MWPLWPSWLNQVCVRHFWAGLEQWPRFCVHVVTWISRHNIDLRNLVTWIIYICARHRTLGRIHCTLCFFDLIIITATESGFVCSISSQHTKANLSSNTQKSEVYRTCPLSRKRIITKQAQVASQLINSGACNGACVYCLFACLFCDYKQCQWQCLDCTWSTTVHTRTIRGRFCSKWHIDLISGLTVAHLD